ncbi:MAG: Na+/H+ antiporter subunit G [Legionellales bacterium]|nr:Na+/H+ antiporter subunit G [Legionellales bacterium]|tara:strand:+ start:46048 stop:46335 length:288 start_codon:yes stop_codon:yes gene_type:complete
MISLIGNSMILIGALFILIATIGLWRMPDIYLKMHAATKAGTLGCGLILLGVGIQLENLHSLTEIILLIFFVAITNPLSAHLIGKLYYSDPSKGQ